MSGSTDIAGVPRISKLVRIMQTVSAPSLTDTIAQQLRLTLAEGLRQPVHIYRRTGGKTSAGIRAVALAAADGYTLLFADNPTITINPEINPTPRFDPLKDLQPVAVLARMPIAMITTSNRTAATVREIIERAHRLPGSINYASAGDNSTSHLTGELFRSEAGAEIVHVGYNGSIPAINAVVTRQVEFGFVPLPAVLPYMGGGKIRIIAIGSAARHPVLPAVPTIAESGIGDFDAGGWFGVFAPAHTPATLVSLLNYQINRALGEESLQQTLLLHGLLPAPASAEEFQALIEKDRERWSRLLKVADFNP